MYDSWKFLVFISERLEIDTLSIWKPIDSARKHWANNHTVNWTYRCTMRSVYLHYSLFFFRFWSRAAWLHISFWAYVKYFIDCPPSAQQDCLNKWLIDWLMLIAWDQLRQNRHKRHSHIQGGAKKRVHPISLQIFWKFHDRIAWKLVNVCDIIC